MNRCRPGERGHDQLWATPWRPAMLSRGVLAGVVRDGGGWWRAANRRNSVTADFRGNNANLLRVCDGGRCFSGGFVIFD